MLETFYILTLFFGNPIQYSTDMDAKYVSMEVCQYIGNEFYRQGGFTAYACTETKREVIE